MITPKEQILDYLKNNGPSFMMDIAQGTGLAARGGFLNHFADLLKTGKIIKVKDAKAPMYKIPE